VKASEDDEFLKDRNLASSNYKNDIDQKRLDSADNDRYL
jgi:hypothetical protein